MKGSSPPGSCCSPPLWDRLPTGWSPEEPRCEAAGRGDPSNLASCPGGVERSRTGHDPAVGVWEAFKRSASKVQRSRCDGGLGRRLRAAPAPSGNHGVSLSPTPKGSGPQEPEQEEFAAPGGGGGYPGKFGSSAVLAVVGVFSKEPD